MTGIVCALAGAKGTTPTTATFTANGTWVAPAGVSSVAVASGKGGPGVSDGLGTVQTCYFAAIQTGTQPNAPFAQWSTPYNSYLATLGAFSGRTYPSYGFSGYTGLDVTYVDTSNRWSRIAIGSDLTGTLLTGYSTSVIGSPLTSGNVTYANAGIISGWIIDVQGYSRGSVGPSSTALGLTFPGGAYTGAYPNAVGAPATTTTFTDVAVTPGASYSIVVPSGGEVTLQYNV